MNETVERTFVVSHSALQTYRTQVTADVPVSLADDPEKIRAWLESGEDDAEPYTWKDAFNPYTDRVDVKSAEIDGVDFDTQQQDAATTPPTDYVGYQILHRMPIPGDGELILGHAPHKQNDPYCTAVVYGNGHGGGYGRYHATERRAFEVFGQRLAERYTKET